MLSKHLETPPVLFRSSLEVDSGVPVGCSSAFSLVLAEGPMAHKRFASLPFCSSDAHEIRNTLRTAGNSMTSSERPSPEPILKKEAPPAVLGERDNSGNALEAANALNYRVWGIPTVLSTGIPGKALRAFPVFFPEFCRNFFPNFPAVLGVWPMKGTEKEGVSGGSPSASYVEVLIYQAINTFIDDVFMLCIRMPEVQLEESARKSQAIKTATRKPSRRRRTWQRPEDRQRSLGRRRRR